MRKKLMLDFDPAAGVIIYQKPMTKTEARKLLCAAMPQLLKETKLPPRLLAHAASEIDHALSTHFGEDYHPHRDRLIYAMDVLDGGFKKKNVPVEEIPANLLGHCLKGKW